MTDAPEVDLHEEETHHRLMRSLLIACSVVLVVVIAIVVGLVANGGGSDGVTHRYVIPAGTAAQARSTPTRSSSPTRPMPMACDARIPAPSSSRPTRW